LLHGQRAAHGGKKLIVGKGLGEKCDSGQMQAGSLRGRIFASRNTTQTISALQFSTGFMLDYATAPFSVAERVEQPTG
jgi:hypothetical protein